MNENSQRTPWYRQAVANVDARVFEKYRNDAFHWPVFGVYFHVLERSGYTTTVMPITLLDRLIGFQPLALPMYLSLSMFHFLRHR